MQKIETRNMLLELDESTLGVAVKTEHIVWSWSKEFRPRIRSVRKGNFSLQMRSRFLMSIMIWGSAGEYAAVLKVLKEMVRSIRIGLRL